MIAVSKSLGATLANGALSLWVQSAAGALIDVFAASVQILDTAGADVVAKTALDMTANRLGLGHYAAAWTPGAASVGQYTVRWFYTVADGDAEQSFDLDFELRAKPYSGPHYCTVQDLRDEGLPASIAEAAVQAMIVRASRYVEHFTGRSFTADRKVLALNGTSSRVLMLNEPIVAIEETLISVVDLAGATNLTVENDTLKIYNRHLHGLTNPDDRDNPKMEFVHGDDLGGVNYSFGQQNGYFLRDLIWPRGRQNVQLTGLFGYTEPDGSFIGTTPAMIREATKLIAFKLRPQMVLGQSTFGGGQVILESTRDQQVQFTAPWLRGAQTGDWAIDSILVNFVRPPNFGAA